MQEKPFYHVGIRKRGGVFTTPAKSSVRRVLVRRSNQLEYFSVGKVEVHKHSGKVVKKHEGRLPIDINDFKAIAISKPAKSGGKGFYNTPSGRTLFFGPMHMRIKVGKRMEEFAGIEIKGAGRSGESTQNHKVERDESLDNVFAHPAWRRSEDDLPRHPKPGREEAAKGMSGLEGDGHWPEQEAGIFGKIHHRLHQTFAESIVNEDDMYETPTYVNDWDWFPPIEHRHDFSGLDGSIPLEDAKREFDNLKQAEKHGVVVPKPIAVFEVPENDLSTEARDIVLSLEKEANTDGTAGKYRLKKLRSGGDIHTFIDPKRIRPGQMIRAVRTPVRLSTIIAKEERAKYAKAKGMTLREYNQFLFKRIGQNLRRLAEAGLVHHSLHEDNITAEGEFTDGADMEKADEHYRESLEQFKSMHEKYPKLKAKKLKLPSFEEFIAFTYTPFLNGLAHAMEYGAGTESGTRDGIEGVVRGSGITPRAAKSEEMTAFLEGLTGSKSSALHKAAGSAKEGEGQVVTRHVDEAFMRMTPHPLVRKIAEELAKRFKRAGGA